jgi:hypothetical protein
MEIHRDLRPLPRITRHARIGCAFTELRQTRQAVPQTWSLGTYAGILDQNPVEIPLLVSGTGAVFHRAPRLLRDYWFAMSLASLAATAPTRDSQQSSLSQAEQ